MGNKFGPFDGAIGHSIGGMALWNAIREGAAIKRLVEIGSPSSLSGVLMDFAAVLNARPAVAEILMGKLSADYQVAEDLRSGLHPQGFILMSVGCSFTTPRTMKCRSLMRWRWSAHGRRADWSPQKALVTGNCCAILGSSNSVWIFLRTEVGRPGLRKHEIFCPDPWRFAWPDGFVQRSGCPKRIKLHGRRLTPFV